MRGNDTIVSQVRDILLDIQELKQRQFTGKNQIVVQEITTEQYSCTTQYYSDHMYNRVVNLTVTAPDLPDGSVLLAFAVPIIRLGGSVIQNQSTRGNMMTIYNLAPIRDANLRRATFSLLLSDSSTDGGTISGSSYAVAFRVYASAKVDISVEVE